MASEDDLKLIDSMVQESKKEKIITKSKEMEKAFVIIRKFIIDNNLIMYGGLALNELLPDNLKFYTKDDVPDYDFYSPSGMTHAVNLANLLYMAGYNYVEVNSAIHENTFRVSVNFTVVADITNLSQAFFKNLFAISKVEKHHYKFVKNDMLMTPINLLKFELYRELAEPNSLFRWRKIYSRMILFCSYHKLPENTGLNLYNTLKSKRNTFVNTTNSDIKMLIHRVSKYIKEKKLPLIGNAAIGMHFKSKQVFLNCCRLDEFFSIFEIMSLDKEKTCQDIEDIFNSCAFKEEWEIIIDQRSYHAEILPTRNRMYIQNKKTLEKVALLTIFNSNVRCLSYVTINGYAVGGLYTILSFLYAYTLLYHVYEAETIVNMVFEMIGAVEMFIKNDIHSSIKDTMLTQCFGFKGSVTVMKKQSFNNTLFNYKPNTNDKLVKSKSKKKK